MRSRAVNNGQSRRDDKELSNDIEEAEIKSSSSSRRYDSVGENSSQKWMIAMLCLGIFFGVFLSLSIHDKSQAMMKGSIEGLHRNVKKVYRAHNVARKEYLRSYREAYLESILAARGPSSSSSSSSSSLDVDVEEIEKGSAEDVSEGSKDSEKNVIARSGEDSRSSPNEEGEIVFKSLENGKKICSPLIDEEFSDLVVEEGNDDSGALTSKAECEWFNQLTKVGLEASKMPSTCVPDDHIFATLTNDYDWDMYMFGLQHIKDEKCFTDRLVILCLDDVTFSKCEAAGFKHCVKYIKSMASSIFMQNDYRQIVWLKPKMALAFLNAKLTVFTLDSDILFFQVPDLAKIKELHPEAELHYQWEKVNYTALYEMENPNEDFEESVMHEGYNSGQVLWMPTANVIKGALRALLRGKEAGGSKVLEQTHTQDGMKDAGVITAGLSFRYAGNWVYADTKNCVVKTNGQNWISYHATWVIGLEKKMEVLKTVEEAWSQLRSGESQSSPNEEGEIVFKSLENGKKICSPLIDEEFSDLVVEEGNDESGALTSKAECEWFNQLTKVGLEASKMPSTCVPDDYIFATLTNDHMWDMSMFGLQHIKDEKCFTDRLVILCLDDVTFSKCEAAGFKHCVKYIKSMASSIFMQNDYRQIVWLKPKMALAFLNAKLTVFTLDSDILFFQVPDLAKIKELHPEAELHYQWEYVDYEALYEMENPNEDFEESVRHEGYNSGQVLWMPTANVIKGTLRALLRGKEGGSGDKLEQAHTQDGMSDAGVNTAGLSFRYAANWQCSTRGVCSVYTKSQNWISYHATWLQGLESKRAILTKVEEAWSKLSSKPANAEDDANDSPLAQCAKSLKAEHTGFGNTFLGDGMKTELDAARGNPGREGGCPTGRLYCSAWEPLHWGSNEDYTSFWNTVSSNGALKEHLIVAAELDEQCAFDPKTGIESIEQDVQKIAAVHFRCSDVPISYTQDYPVAPPEYSSFVGKKFREWGMKRVVPILCVEHGLEESIRDDRQKQCEELFNLQLNIIKREMITNDENVHFDDITCLSEKTTLMAIRDLGASAILVPSSFTFPAGLAREDGSKFIMPHFGVQGVSPADVLLQSKINDEIILRMQSVADAMPVTVFCPRCGNDIADTPEGATQWNIDVWKPLLEKYASKN